MRSTGQETQTKGNVFISKCITIGDIDLILNYSSHCQKDHKMKAHCHLPTEPMVGLEPTTDACSVGGAVGLYVAVGCAESKLKKP